MAWEARWGLKLDDYQPYVILRARLNGLGSPMGIETST